MALFRRREAEAGRDLTTSVDSRLIDATVARMNARTRDILYARVHKFIATILGFILGIAGIKTHTATPDLSKPVPVERSATPQIQGERRSGSPSDEEDDNEELPRDVEPDFDGRSPRGTRPLQPLQLAVKRYSEGPTILRGWLWEPGEIHDEMTRGAAREVLDIVREKRRQELDKRSPNPKLLEQYDAWIEETENELKGGADSI